MIKVNKIRSCINCMYCHKSIEWYKGDYICTKDYFLLYLDGESYVRGCINYIPISKYKMFQLFTSHELTDYVPFLI